jgi:SAM-dependent methyltransferase
VIAEAPSQLYRYYQQSELLPTFARLQSEQQLRAYEAGRAATFEKWLHLPRRVFAGADVLEFGPDSGENSLVFARWGASLTLAEPNPRCWEQIERYFDRFGLSRHLVAVEHADLEQFESERQFDVIDAEGFIYTVRPESLWMERFARLLRPGGHFVISYYETTGGLFELLHRALFARVKQLTGDDSTAVARRLYQPKWDSIPHTRAFDSWVMDVLENPFVRLSYFFDAAGLCRQLAHFGFDLYSSWPRYEDGLSLHWHKGAEAAGAVADRNEEFLRSSCLSFALGRKLFLGAVGRQERERTYSTLREVIVSVDRLIDSADPVSMECCCLGLEDLAELIDGQNVIAGSHTEKQAASRVLSTVAKTLRSLLAGNVDAVVDVCRHDPDFLTTWGAPAHFGVFQKAETPR